MKRLAPALAAFVLLASALSATPLVWKFAGTASAASQYDGSSIAGLTFEVRIFLDTSLPAVDPMGLADVFFLGPHSGQVEIQGLGVKPLNPFTNVQYFAPSGMVTGVQFNQPAFSDIFFASAISSDSLHLTPIAPTMPVATNNTLQSGVMGPNGLFLSGIVQTFSAVATATPDPVPDTTSTVGLWVPILLSVAFLRRRVRQPATA